MIGLWNLTIIDHKRDARPGGWCHLYRCHGTIVPAWLLFVQYKKKLWPSTWSMNFFVLLPKTWTHARIIQQPQSIHATQPSMPHNSSVPTKLGQMEERIAITQTAENHATLNQFITQSQTFLFFLSFFLILVPWQFHKLIPNFHNSTFSWMKPPSLIGYFLKLGKC